MVCPRSEVSRHYGIKPTALTAVRRGIENERRDVAVYFALRAADERWCRFWIKPIQFSQQRGYASKNKVAKGAKV